MMFARVCSYDRANTFAGASDPAPTPRKAEDIVADLHALLSEATVPCPYILVGHSYGGLTARLYASLYPEQVAGIVFVDASHEDQTDRLVPLLSAEHLEFVEQVESSNVEGVDMAASSEEMRSARSTHPLQPMPLFVLTAGQPTDPAAMPPDWPLEEEARIWNELHEDLAGLVPGGRRMVAEQSGHYIHQSQPVLVVEAIRVASITRVCTYDRANTSGGASDPAPTPRTGDEVVADLHALLAAAGESGPYVLVGHSVGAIFGRQYASRYPEDVAGLVLVDPSHEDQNERMRALLSPEQWLAYEQMHISIEGLDFYASFAQMKDARAAAPLRPMPLIVLTAGHPRILPPFHPAGR